MGQRLERLAEKFQCYACLQPVENSGNLGIQVERYDQCGKAEGTQTKNDRLTKHDAISGLAGARPIFWTRFSSRIDAAKCHLFCRLIKSCPCSFVEERFFKGPR